jgi:apolipoprotein N-acyltransferase
LRFFFAMAGKDSGVTARLGLALSALSAVALFAAGEPLGFGPLGWVALVPLAVAVLRAPSAARAAAYGIAFGVAYFAIELSWIFLFGWMAWTALTLFLSFYMAAGTFVAGLLRKSSFAPLWFAGAWTGAELLRDRFPYGGYSWGAVGTTQGTVPGVRWLAGTIGVYGLSFLAALVSAVIADGIVRKRFQWRTIGIAAAALAVFVALDATGSRPDGEPFRLAVVQGNVPRPATYDQRDRILDGHVKLTKKIAARGAVDLIVWPEDAVGVGVSPGAIGRVQRLAAETGTPFLVGRSLVSSETKRFLNLVQHVEADGKLGGTYQKRHPVPFGEYVPIGFFRRFVGTLQSEIPLDLAPGRRANTFDIAGTKIATPICFESVFPRDILDFTRNGAELLILSTNDSSFEHSYSAQQHLAHTRMRALETRQWVVQAALSGISAQIDPDGTITHATGLFEPASFVADVRTRPASSLYAKTGDVFPMGFAIATALAALTSLRRRKIESEP